MTPYWPSPLGATRRRFAPRPEVQTFLFSTETFRSRAPVARSFPKPNRRLTWIADADRSATDDGELRGDGPLPELS